MRSVVLATTWQGNGAGADEGEGEAGAQQQVLASRSGRLASSRRAG
jgi:hypothetical protein